MKIVKMLVIGVTIATCVGAYAADEPSDATKRKTVTSQYYVDTRVETKQPVVGAESGNYVIMYPNSTGGDTNHDSAGEINKRHVSNVLSGNASDNIAVANDHIPTVGAVNSGLNGKQNVLSGTAGKLVTYGDAAGVTTSTDVYNEAGAYNSTTSQGLVRAAHVNAAVANAFSRLLTCNIFEDGWNASMTGSENHCLIYEVHTDMASGTYVPHN